MKKMFRLLLLLTFLIVLAACGNNEGDTGSDSGDGNGYSGESMKLKLGFNTPDDSVRGEAGKKFKEIVEDKTDGKVTVELFSGETLGTEQEMVEQVQSGALELQLVGAGAMQNIIPEYAILQLPFMVDDFEEAYAVLDGEIGDELKDIAYDKGFKVLTHTDLGFTQITNNKHPVSSPDDLKGLKIRTPEEPTSLITFEKLGASVTTMPFTEVYLGLQQGVIDGQFNPLDAIYENNMQEVQDYLTLTNHFYLFVNFVMNKDLYDGLDDELKGIIDEAAEEAQKVSREYTQEMHEEMLDTLRDDFEEIVEDPDIDAFRDKIDYSDFDEVMDPEFINKTREFIEDLRD